MRGVCNFEWEIFWKTCLRALFLFDDVHNMTVKQTSVLEEIFKKEIAILEQMMATAEMK